MSKHTKGPWGIVETQHPASYLSGLYVVSDGENVIDFYDGKKDSTRPVVAQVDPPKMFPYYNENGTQRFETGEEKKARMDATYANAQLIAAAPQLLEALKGLIEAMNKCPRGDELSDWGDAEIAKALAAIAGAEGGGA